MNLHGRVNKAPEAVLAGQHLVRQMPVQARLINQTSSKSKDDFRCSSCVILVSVGQLAHEAEKLAATIRMVNKSYASCAIAVCDSLQRHSLQLDTGYSDNVVHQISNNLGEKWIERNRQYFAEISIPCEIFRWDDWLLRKDFLNYQAIINKMYSEDLEFRDSMNKTALNFVKRFQKRQEQPLKTKVVRQASINYLIEECAIIMLMWQEKGYNYIVYPSDILEVMKKTYQKLVSPYNENLLQWVRIKLKTKKPAKLVGNVSA